MSDEVVEELLANEGTFELLEDGKVRLVDPMGLEPGEPTYRFRSLEELQETAKNRGLPVSGDLEEIAAALEDQDRAAAEGAVVVLEGDE